MTAHAEGPARPAGARLRWGRERRIQRRPDFLAVYDRGRRMRGRLVTLFALERRGPAGEALPWRLGVTATRKSGSAVERNRQRRRLREFFRLNQCQIPDGWDFVVNTTRALNTAPRAALAEDLERTLRPFGVKPRPAAAP